MGSSHGPVAYEWSGRVGARYPRIFQMPVLHNGPEHTVEAQIDTISRRLREMPIGRRALMIDGWLGWRIFGEGKTYVDLFADRVDIDAAAAYLRPLFDGLRRPWAMPTMIVLDNESTHSPHAWIWAPTDAERIERASRLYADPEAVSRLPAALRDRKPEEFDPWTESGRQLVADLHAHAVRQRASWFRQVLVRAGYPLTRRSCVTNFGDLTLRPGESVPDSNGWPEHRVTITDDAAPCVYPWAGSDDPVALWREVVRAVNIDRACLRGLGRGSMRRWVGSHCWGGADASGKEYHRGVVVAWHTIVYHTVAAGGDLILWNPERRAWGSDAVQDRLDPDRLCDAEQTARMLSESLGKFPRRIPVKRDLPDLPPDPEAIVTVNDGLAVVTQRKGFLAEVERIRSGAASGGRP